MALDYTKKVIKYFKHPRNVGEIKKPDGVATLGSPACGDMVTTYLKIDSKSLRIRDVKFKSYGCAANIATASVISEKAKGKKIGDILKMDLATAAKELGGLPPVKMHCSVLAVNTLKEAIKDYMVKHGLAKKEEIPLTDDSVLKELAFVINPEIGLNIVRLKMVKNVRIKNGVVEVKVKLGNTDEIFASNIREEVKEHVEKIKGVRKVVVKIAR